MAYLAYVIPQSNRELGEIVECLTGNRGKTCRRKCRSSPPRRPQMSLLGSPELDRVGAFRPHAGAHGSDFVRVERERASKKGNRPWRKKTSPKGPGPGSHLGPRRGDRPRGEFMGWNFTVAKGNPGGDHRLLGHGLYTSSSWSTPRWAPSSRKPVDSTRWPSTSRPAGGLQRGTHARVRVRHAGGCRCPGGGRDPENPGSAPGQPALHHPHPRGAHLAELPRRLRQLPSTSSSPPSPT